MLPSFEGNVVLGDGEGAAVVGAAISGRSMQPPSLGHIKVANFKNSKSTY